MMTDAATASQMVESGLLMKSQQLRELKHYDTFEDSSSRCLLSAYFGRHIENETWVAGAFMDDEPIAIAFGFKRNDNWFLYQLSMKDDEFGKYSPGTHLMMFILSKAIDGNCKLFEFGLGDEPYKKEWCEIEDETRIELKALTWKGWIACLIHRQKYKLLRHLVHGGKLWRAAKASQKLLKQAGLAG